MTMKRTQLAHFAVCIFVASVVVATLGSNKRADEARAYRIRPDVWVASLRDQTESKGEFWLATDPTQVLRHCDTARIVGTHAAGSRRAQIGMGIACGKLWILINEPLRDAFRDPEFSDFASHHEGFHLSVQLNELRPRLDQLDFPYGPPWQESSAKVTRFVAELSAAADAFRFSRVCQLLEGAPSALGSAGYAALRAHSYWEWPAEWYSSVATANSRQQYEKLRSRYADLVGDGHLYVHGRNLLGLVDQRIDRAEWQSAYMSGESVLNLVAVAAGCSKVDPSAPQVNSFKIEWDIVEG